MPEPLTEEEMSKIKLGTSAIYFYGAISYRDAFSRQPQDAVPLSAWRRARVRHRGSRALAAGQQGELRRGRDGPRNERSPAGGRRGFFLNSPRGERRDGSGEATTHTGLSLSRWRGAVILSHDQTRRTLRLSASARVERARHYRDITVSLLVWSGRRVGKAQRAHPAMS